MAFRRNKGLKYFPLVTDFFQDRDIRRLMLNFGQRGTLLYIYLLCCLYGRGYVLRWDEDLMQDAAIDLRCEPEELQRSVDYMLEKGLFNRELFDRCGLLSSEAIQRQFQDCARVMRVKRTVDRELWLLSAEETDSNISFDDIENVRNEAAAKAKCEKQGAECENSPSKCENSTQRKGKENKKKLKEMEAATAAEKNDEAEGQLPLRRCAPAPLTRGAMGAEEVDALEPPSDEGGGICEARANDGGRDENGAAEGSPLSLAALDSSPRGRAKAQGGLEGTAAKPPSDEGGGLSEAKDRGRDENAAAEGLPLRRFAPAPLTRGAMGEEEAAEARANDGGREKNAVAEEILGEFEGFMSMSEFAQKELSRYQRELGTELCLNALRRAMEMEKPHWSYVRGILRSYKSQGFKSVEQALEEERRHRGGYGFSGRNAPPSMNYGAVDVAGLRNAVNEI